MKTISYINNLEDIKRLADAGIKEALLCFKDFSRTGKLELKDLDNLLLEINKYKLLPVLDWDILMTENVFVETTKILNTLPLNQFSAVRVQDPGAMYWMKKHHPLVKLHLNLETGNHNLEAIVGWVDFFGSQVQRVVLSLELPKAKLEQYSHVLNEKKVEVEFLLFGRILLFYTPRSLLSPLYLEHDDKNAKEVHKEYLELTGSSEESPHKGFPVVETKHGTFMYHVKDHWLIEQINELKAIGIQSVRLDARHCSEFDLKEATNLILQFDLDQARKLKEIYPYEVIRGFFHVNKTDTLFTKLKNKNTQRIDEGYIGEVLESTKDGFITFINKADRPVLVGEELRIVNPEGKEIKLTLKKLVAIDLNECQLIKPNELGLINYHSGVVVKSQVYHV